MGDFFNAIIKSSDFIIRGKYQMNEMDKKVEEVSQDILNIFDTFIKKGTIEREREIIPGLKIKLRPLSLGEVSDAEARVNHMSDVSPDVVHKIRSAIILSEAIIALNDSPIEKENTEIADIKIRRRSLYIKLMQMPTSIIMKIWEEYLSAVKEQESLLNAETTKEKLSDF